MKQFSPSAFKVAPVFFVRKFPLTLVLLCSALLFFVSCKTGAPAVGFVYDSNDIEGVNGGALIIDLFDDSNADVISPGDVIIEYRGEAISSGSELDLVIDKLDDVNNGDKIILAILSQGVQPSILVEVIAKKKKIGFTKIVVYENATCNSVGNGCRCDDDTHTCTYEREWRQKAGAPKKYEHQTRCSDTGGGNCTGPWLNGK